MITAFGAEAPVFQTAAESGNGVTLFDLRFAAFCLGHLCKNRASRNPTFLGAVQGFSRPCNSGDSGIFTIAVISIERNMEKVVARRRNPHKYCTF